MWHDAHLPYDWKAIAKMSTVVMAQCWPLQMPPTPKAVLISLADNANDHGHCWPSLTKIGERTCFGRTAVIDAIKWLESHGILKADRGDRYRTTYIVSPSSYVGEVLDRLTDQSARRTSSDDGELVREADNEVRQTDNEVREADTNRQEPSRTVNKSNRKRIADDPTNFVLPDWIPTDAWRDWCRHRQALRCPLTAKAMELSVKSLDKLRGQGHAPIDVINNAIELSYRGLFAPKMQSDGVSHGNSYGPRSRKLSAVDQVTQAIHERRQREPIDDEASATAFLGYG